MDNTERSGLLEVDIKHLLRIVISRLWIILLVGVICASMTLGYAWFFVTPTYVSSVQFYVNNQVTGSPGFSSSQITAAQSLADTYMVILRSRAVLEEVAKQTNLGYSYNQLRAMVGAAAVNKTEVFQVDVISADYKHSAKIANAIADVLPDKITSVVDGSSVRVVDYAVENPNRVAPSYRNAALVGAVVGCALTAILIVVMELTDTTINSEDYLTQVYGSIPLLAVIPGTQGNKSKYYRGYYKGNYEVAQQKKAPPKKAEPEKKKPEKRTPEKNNGGAKQ